MAMNLTCLNIYPPLPVIPITANVSNTFVHPSYKPDGGGITQMISASMARSTFSTDDVESLLKKAFDTNSDIWTVSEITKTKPVPSIIIYTTMALTVFLGFLFTFCGISCRKQKERKGRQSKAIHVCVCLLIIVYLLGIGDMIYVAYRVNQSKASIDDAIKQVNRDVYPKEISEHMQYLNKQLEVLDQYCISSNSILITASKSMLVKAFDRILNEKYFVQDIIQTVNSIGQHIHELSVAIDNETSIPDTAKYIFQDIQRQYQSMINYTQLPLKEVCDYANGKNTDIDRKLLEALDVVHRELKRVIDTINQDILSKITPWQNHMLMDIDFEEQIRSYISLAGTVGLVLVIILAVIPVVFFVFIMISRLCGCDQSGSCENNQDHFGMKPVTRLTDVASTNGYSDVQDYSRHRSRRVAPSNHRGQMIASKGMSASNGPSSLILCLMRIAFGIMIVMLIILVLLTGVYYALDLAVQGSCRTVHDDQPFLINFVTEKLIESNIVFVNSSVMNTTMTDVINDCRDHVHFSGKLLQSYWSILDRDVIDMMNALSKKIYDRFIESIGKIDIPEDIDLLVQLANQTNISNIVVILDRIDTNLNTMEGLFGVINSSNATLPQSLVQTTIDEFKDYVKQVLELTIDGCPLPLATIYKTDTLVCHTMGSSLSGLWLSIFLCMVLITVGLCIFGVCVYKRLNWPSGSISLTRRSY